MITVTLVKNKEKITRTIVEEIVNIKGQETFVFHCLESSLTVTMGQVVNVLEAVGALLLKEARDSAIDKETAPMVAPLEEHKLIKKKMKPKRIQISKTGRYTRKQIKRRGRLLYALITDSPMPEGVHIREIATTREELKSIYRGFPRA